MTVPNYQRRMMGYDQPGGYRSVASSWSGALLTVGTSVTPHGRWANVGSTGVIRAIREGADLDVLVLWPGRTWPEWRKGSSLDRVGRAR